MAYYTVPHLALALCSVTSRACTLAIHLSACSRPSNCFCRSFRRWHSTWELARLSHFWIKYRSYVHTQHVWPCVTGHAEDVNVVWLVCLLVIWVCPDRLGQYRGGSVVYRVVFGVVDVPRDLRPQTNHSLWPIVYIFVVVLVKRLLEWIQGKWAHNSLARVRLSVASSCVLQQWCKLPFPQALGSDWGPGCGGKVMCVLLCD